MSLRIRIEHGQDAGRTYRLPKDGVYVLGRHPAASLRVLDMKVSKAHCEIHLATGDAGPQAMLIELGSTHGSLVNGQPVTKERPKGLKPGDELRLGLSILRILSDGDADEDLAPAVDRAVDGEDMAKVTGMGTRDHTKSAKELPPDELVGRELGGYKVLKKIGQGGMGAVYIAQQVSLHRQVALKVLSEKFVKDSTFVDQFLNEARAAGQLNHPNVVQVYDVGEAEGHYYFSMEFVTGGSLEEKLKAGEDYTWQEALNWFLDATNALIFAAKRGILHRDVKPDNLMISEDETAKLCDLGLAKRPDDSDLMDQGIIGTPHFISPEAIRRKTNIDVRTDLYSLGCTFFRLLSGENPYPGKTVKEILLGHLNKPVPRVTDHKREVPRDLDEIVYKLMQKEPDERYQTPEDLLADLDKVRLRHGLEAHGLKPSSRKPLLIMGAAAALLIGVILFVFLGKDPEQVVVKQPAHVIFRQYESQVDSLESELIKTRSALKDRLGALRIKRSEGNIERTWADDKWTTMAEDLDTLAADAESQVGEWRAAKEKAPGRFREAIEKVRAGSTKTPEDKRARQDVESLPGMVREAYEEAIAEVATIQEDAAKIADKEIRAYVEQRRANQAREAAAREEALSGATQDAKSIAKAAREAPDVVALTLVLDPEKIQARIDFWSEKQVDGTKVVEREADIVPIFVAELGEEFGQKSLLAPAIQAVRDAHTQAMKEGGELAEPGTIQALEAAITHFETYRDSLPEKPDPTAGDISTQLLNYRQIADTRISEHKRRIQAIRDADFEYDRKRLFVLIHHLRRPAYLNDKGGLYAGWAFDDAVAEAKAAERALRTDAHRELAGMHRRDAEALQAFVEKLVSSYEDWEEKRFQYENDAGKTERGTIKGITSKTVMLKNDSRLNSELGPLGFIDIVAFYKGQPRVPYAGSDWRALALLAELGGDRERATTWWKQYEGSLDPAADAALMADARRKQALLPREMDVAQKYFEVIAMAAEMRAFLDARDPKDLGAEGFDEDIRKEILTEQPILTGRLNEAGVKLDMLKTDPAWSVTAWAAGLRKEPPATPGYVSR